MKKIMLLSSLLLLMLIFISGCSVQEGVPVQKEPVDKGGALSANATPELIVQKPLTCDEWANSLFPEQWVFRQDVTQDPKLTREVLYLYQGKWKNDAFIKGTSSTRIQQGSETGENVNYYYAKPIYISLDKDKYGFSYEAKIIDIRGNVLGDNSFLIRPVFRVIYDFVKEENNTYNLTVKMRYLSLIMVEPNIVSCKKVD